MPTWPDGVTLVTIRHTPVTTGGRTYRGLVTARASERLFEADRTTGGDSSILPADASTNIEPDGSWEIQLPAVDAGILPEGAAYWLVEHVTGAEGKGVWVAPMTHHAPGPVGLADVMTAPPAKGGGITIQTGPATDPSMAEIADDPDSEFRRALSGMFATREEISEIVTGDPVALTDAAVAGPLSDPASASRAALDLAYGRGTVRSDVISRILTSTDSSAPTQEGDLLLVYGPPAAHFTDFTDGLAGFTRRYATTTWTVGDDPTSISGRVVRTENVAQRQAQSWDWVDAEGPFAADVELVTRVKVPAVGAYYSGGLIARGSGTAGADTGYVLETYNGSLRIHSSVEGARTRVGFTAFPYAAGEWYWLRFRVHGQVLRAKAWLDGDAEPTDWTLERTDESITGPGHAGLWTTALTTTWDLLGVAVDGATAPKAP